MISGKELFDWLNKIAVDKLLHFVCGLLVAQVAFVCLGFAVGKWWSLLGALLISSAVAAVKEAVDVKYGVPSWEDFGVSIIGIFVGLSILSFV
jgi:hypothetical protein